jgi:uncharacterized membrane protein HdeD (DUF308 family)
MSEPNGYPEPEVTRVDMTEVSRVTANVLLTLGIITALIGAVMLFWPEATVRVVAILFGVWLILSGIVLLVQAFGSRASGAMKVLLALAGVVSIIVGGICIVNSEASVTILVIFVVIGWLAHGIAYLYVGFRDKTSPDRGVYLFFGALLVVLALLVLFWPKATVIVLVRVIGIGLLLTAALEIWASVKARQNPPQGEIVVVSE